MFHEQCTCGSEHLNRDWRLYQQNTHKATPPVQADGCLASDGADGHVVIEWEESGNDEPRCEAEEHVASPQDNDCGSDLVAGDSSTLAYCEVFFCDVHDVDLPLFIQVPGGRPPTIQGICLYLQCVKSLYM